MKNCGEEVKFLVKFHSYHRQPCCKQTSSQVFFKNWFLIFNSKEATILRNTPKRLLSEIAEWFFFDIERRFFNMTDNVKWKCRAWTISTLGTLKILLMHLLISEKLSTYSTLVSPHINFSFFNFVQTHKHILSVYKQHY